MKEIIKELNFALYSIYKNIESSAELRMSFWFAVFGMALNNVAFLIVWMSFGQIAGDMGGWQSVDYLLAFGISTLSYGLVFGFFSGIRNLPEIVRFGDFDKFLLSPKTILLRLSTSKFEAPAIGDLLFGIISVAAWIYLTGNFSTTIILSIIFFSFMAMLIWYFYSVLVNSLAFYFADSRTIVQGFFEMLITPSIFYGGAFQGFLRNIFIFVVPSMLLGNLPLEIIKNPSINMYLLVIGITFVWTVLALYFFKVSVKKYESSNFINFG